MVSREISRWRIASITIHLGQIPACRYSTTVMLSRLQESLVFWICLMVVMQFGNCISISLLSMQLMECWQLARCKSSTSVLVHREQKELQLFLCCCMTQRCCKLVAKERSWASSVTWALAQFCHNRSG